MACVCALSQKTFSQSTLIHILLFFFGGVPASDSCCWQLQKECQRAETSESVALRRHRSNIDGTSMPTTLSAVSGETSIDPGFKCSVAQLSRAFVRT